MPNDNFIDKYFIETADIIKLIDKKAIMKMIDIIIQMKKKSGRLFMLGVGGGAANASHAVNDFRKIAGIEAYAPTDNASEFTARVNDDGWDTVFVNWLKGSRLVARDCIFIFSVGGGNAEKNISNNLVHALKYARGVGSKIMGIVGKDGGYTAEVADAVVIVPTVNEEAVTAYVESFQSVILHLLVSHPAIKVCEMKWESMR